jgi:DNA mismatch repair protein MutS2
LGAGTDPGEGSALARAILSYLLDMGATTLVATHYPELKVFAHNTAGVANASVEFDLETLAPTFHLTVGLPGRSNAFAIASRLGLEATIIDDARTMVTTTDLEAEKLLDEIHRQRDLARAERAEAEALHARAAEHEQRLAGRLDGIEAERNALFEAARAEAAKELAAVREELQEARQRVRRIAESARPAAQTTTREQALEALEEAEIELEKVEDAQAARPIPAPVSRPSSLGARTGVRLGDMVYLPSLKAEGQVIALTQNEAEVQVGRLRVRAKVAELALRKPETVQRPAAADPGGPSLPNPVPGSGTSAGRADGPRSAVSRQPSAVGGQPSPGLELDLRGQTVEEALPELERYLDAAYLAGLPWVRIIHGKGTGKLRQAVRDELRRSPLVKSHESGDEREGGEGVTVAKLAVAD